MMTFAFTAFGEKIHIQAENQNKAMEMANKKFPLGAGCWFENRENAFQFDWMVGNFFD